MYIVSLSVPSLLTQFARSRLLHAAACRSDCWNERWDPCDIPKNRKIFGLKILEM